MTSLNTFGKRTRSLAAVSALVLILSACGGSPPPLPPPPSNGGYYGGGGGSATCGSMQGTSISYGQPVTGTSYSGASVTLMMGAQLSQLTGSVNYYLPDIQGNSSYVQSNPNTYVCLSTTTQNGSASPGTYSGGYIQASLYGSVPYQMIPIYGQQVPSLGTSYSGFPVQYAQAQGYISGYVAGTSFVGTAQISIPALQYQNQVSTSGGGYGGGGYGW